MKTVRWLPLLTLVCVLFISMLCLTGCGYWYEVIYQEEVVSSPALVSYLQEMQAWTQEWQVLPWSPSRDAEFEELLSELSAIEAPHWYFSIQQEEYLLAHENCLLTERHLYNMKRAEQDKLYSRGIDIGLEEMMMQETMVQYKYNLSPELIEAIKLDNQAERIRIALEARWSVWYFYKLERE